MKIRIVGIGKINENFIQDGCAFYLNRLKHYAQVEQVVLPDLKNGHKLPKEELMEKESELLLKTLQEKEVLVVLDERGKEFSSKDLANQLEAWNMNGIKQVAFVIGGSNGHGEDIKQKARLKLSLSKMTFPHQMIRLFLLEQLYRAFTICNNEPYHKD